MPERLQQPGVELRERAGEASPPGGEVPLIFSRFRRDFDNVEIRDFDFKRPERIAKEQMRALQTMHETFGRSLGASLSGLLRMIVEIRVVQAEQMTYSEFIAGLPNPTSFVVIDAQGLDGPLCLELSPLVVYPLVDRLLGGANREIFVPQREMTAIEVRIVRTILSRAMEALGEAWENLRPVNFKVAQVESNPQMVQILAPSEVVAVLGFEIRMASRAGTMSLCIPYKSIEPVVGELAARSWSVGGPVREGERWRSSVSRHLADALLEVSAVLARTTITMSELQNLEPGDLLVTGRSSRAPAVLEVEGRPKFLASIGQSRGSRALRVLRPVEPADRV